MDNISKNFRIVVSKSRETDVVKSFYYRYIRKCNHIVTDGFNSYNFWNNINSGYDHIIHIHWRNDFEHGLESTSHFEGLWHNLKILIISIYKICPNKNILYYLKEAEWDIRLKI